MSRIKSIKGVNTPKGVKILIETRDMQQVWIPLGQWNNKVGNNPMESYVGGEVQVDFYQKGDFMPLTGNTCTDSNKIMRDFSVSQNPEVAAIAQVVTNERELRRLEEINAEYIAKRNARLAEQALKAQTEPTEEVQKV